jgi:hypothetical protein
VIVNTLMEINPKYPTVDAAARRELLEAKASLEAEVATPPPGPSDGS